MSLRLMMVHAVEELPGEVEIGRQGGAHRDRGAAARRQLSRGRGGDVYDEAGEGVRERAGHMSSARPREALERAGEPSFVS